jgi:hypothetical protein
LLLSRYGGGYNNILALDFLDAVEIINHAIKTKSEDFLRLRWAINHDHIAFDEFKMALDVRQTVEDKPVESILADVFKVIEGGGKQ